MKKIFPIAAIALSAMAAGCSSDNDNGPKDPTRDAISFANPYVANSINQREVATKANVTEFKVWGFVNQPDSYVFSDNTVTKTGNEWTVDRLEYWYLNQKYYFTGLAPIDESVTFTPLDASAIATDGTYTGGGTINFNNRVAEGEEDLIYAFTNPAITHTSLENIQPVGMTFNHMLSQVTFQFKNEVSKATILEIGNLTLKTTPSEGSIDMASAEKAWTVKEGDVPFDIVDIDTENTKTTGSKQFAETELAGSEPVFIIPASAEYTITFNVIVRNGSQIMDTYTHTVSLPPVEFEKGNSYRFTATLNPQNLNPEHELEPIKFTVETVNNWIQNPDMPIN